MNDFLRANDIALLRRFVPKTRDEYLKHIQTIYNLKLHTDFPLIAHIETTNYCNQKCIMCPHPSTGRKFMHIEEEIAKKAIEECALMQPWFVHFFFFGEPLINKATLDYMKYAKSVGVKRVSITTNLTLPSKEDVEEMVDSGIDSIHVSFEGLDRHSYKRIRKTDHYEKVIENLEHLLAYRKKQKTRTPWVSLTYVRTTETDEEIKKYKERWASKIDDMHISPQFEFRNGSVNGERRPEIKSSQIGGNDGGIMYRNDIDRVACRQLWVRLVVLSNGELVPCSQNIDGELSLGNIRDMSMREAWTGSEMSDLRMQHISNNFCGKRGETCKGCTDWDWGGKIDNRPKK
jgi:radical SAM protein with 4Fe4S-binding SPASM domain